MAGETKSFQQIIEEAQAPVGGGKRDAANPFSVQLPKTDSVVDLGRAAPKIPGNQDYDFEAHVEYLALPKAAVEYERILNMALRGEAIIRSEDKTFDKEGDFLVVVQYLTYKLKPKKKRVSEGEDRDRHD